MEFVDANAGRKIRLHVQLDFDYFPFAPEKNAPFDGGFVVPSVGCPEKPLSELTTMDCILDSLTVLEATAPDRAGMSYEHGIWKLNGYFASTGYVNVFMGQNVYSITPLTPVETVS